MSRSPDSSVSELLSRAVDYLFLNNPKATTTGILLGLTLNILSKILQPLIAGYIDLEVVNVFEWIVIGIALSNLPYLIKPELSKELEDALLVLKRINKDASLSKAEKRLYYRLLIQKVVDHIATQKDLETSQTIEKNNPDENLPME